jgi:hypothetical protein
MALRGCRGLNRKKVKGESIMDVLNFIIAVVALIIGVMAYQRTGGIKDLRKSTAELLSRMEKKMREEEAAKVAKEKMPQ